MIRPRSHACAKTEPYKLKRLLSLAIDTSCNWRAVAFLLLLAGQASPVWAQPRDNLVWLLRDLPPMTIFEGPKKGLGVIDQLMPRIIAAMPHYDHTLMRVNRARGMQMLHEESFTCDPSLVWTKEREKWIVFSIPAFRAVSNGLVIRKEDRPLLEPFLVGGEVDLSALLASGDRKVGVIAERSYGPYLDNLLQQAPPGVLTFHYGNDALGSLLQMQRLGRLQLVMGYWPEIRYQASQEHMHDDELAFFSVKGTGKYISAYIGCSNTVQGRQAINEINQILRSLQRDSVDRLYADWLDPDSRRDYLQDTNAFFEHQAQQ